MHHIIFSLGFALQTLDLRIVSNLIWYKPNATPNALHTAFTRLKAVATRHAGATSPHSREP